MITSCPPSKNDTLAEQETGEAYRFVPRKRKLMILALLRAAL